MIFELARKARIVSVGERGSEVDTYTTGPKGFIEFNWWVLREKIKLGLVLSSILAAGYLLSYMSFGALVFFAIILFLIGIIKGGDIETGP